MARQPDGTPFDETSDPNPDRSTQSALDAERIVGEGSDEHGFESAILRCRLFYAHDAINTRQFGDGLLAGRMPIIGSGLLGRRNAPMSWLHIDDAGSAYAAAIEGNATGIFHIIDNEPVPLAVYLRALAERLDTSSPRRVPAWLARLFVSEHIVRLLSCPMPTTNKRFQSAFDWSPQYPTYREGLDQIVERWRQTSTIRETEDRYEWTDE